MVYTLTQELETLLIDDLIASRIDVYSDLSSLVG